MDLVDQKQDEAVHNIIKVYLAQVNSALKISNIICEHSGEDEISGDHIICGLIYGIFALNHWFSFQNYLDSLHITGLGNFTYGHFTYQCYWSATRLYYNDTSERYS